MRRLGLSCASWAPVAVGLIVGRAAAVTFTDVTNAAFLIHTQSSLPVDPGLAGVEYFSGGVAAGDFDGDGWTDLVFTRLGAADVFYHNNGNGTFDPRTFLAGFNDATYTSGVVSGDVDNDGDLDLYITGTANATRNYLYLNDGNGFFTDAGTANPVAQATGVPRAGQGASFGDVNHDGYLDLLTSDWGNGVASSQSALLINRGASDPGVFDDATAAAGLDVYREDIAYRFSPRFVDLDRDGHLDVTFASDFETSQLFWNNGDGTFTDGTLPAGVGTDYNGMGTTFADYDRDGDLDWFITNITQDPEHPGPFGGFNRLYRNDGNRQFTDVTLEAGVRDSRWAWGTSFFEADNDGDVDLIATNGFNGDGWIDDRTYFWTNDNGVFTDVSDAAGITDTQQGRGLIHLDYDQDGDLDIVIVNNGEEPILYRNNTIESGDTNDYLRIHTEGTESNPHGIGAFITVTPDLDNPQDRQVWEIDGGSSFLSQNEHTAHFGLGELGGDGETVDLVTIQWDRGIVQHLHGVTANQTLTVVETDVPAAPGDINFDGSVDADDIDWLRLALQDAALYAAVFGMPTHDACDLTGDDGANAGDVDYLVQTILGSLQGDANLSGQVEQGDLDAVLQNWGSTQGVGWATGDLNGSGQVEQGDLDLVLQNWGSAAAPDFGGASLPGVPEPATLGVFGLALAARRRRPRVRKSVGPCR